LREQFSGVSPSLNEISCGPTDFYPHVPAVGPPQGLQTLEERSETSLPLGILWTGAHEHADTPHPLGLLRARFN
jgi:hypothetical protein